MLKSKQSQTCLLNTEEENGHVLDKCRKPNTHTYDYFNKCCGVWNKKIIKERRASQKTGNGKWKAVMAAPGFLLPATLITPD